MGGYRYSITFIDDFSYHGHVEIIHEKSDSLVAIKEFKVKINLQNNKKLKSIRSDIGGEFYGRYDEIERNLGPFAIYLHECGTDAQYTMPNTFQ